MADMKWMLSSDQQIPYHDPRALDLWFKVMKWFKPDIIDYLGDTSDQACYARFTEGGSTEFLNAIKRGATDEVFPFVEAEELPTREFYAQTRAAAKNAEIFVALGNHDIRIWKYLDQKLPEVVALATPESLWGLDNIGAEYIYYNDVPKQRYGDIYVHHGISISKHAGESVRNDVTDLGVSLIRGHSHRAGAYFKTLELREETLRGYEIGHMCDEFHPIFKYTQVHNWQKAFMIGHIESGSTKTKDGYWPHMQLIHISPEYTCYVDGKLFSA